MLSGGFVSSFSGNLFWKLIGESSQRAYHSLTAIVSCVSIVKRGKLIAWCGLPRGRSGTESSSVTGNLINSAVISRL